MNNKICKVCERNSYSLFIIPGQEDIMNYLSKNYPFDVAEENLYTFKNKNQILCLVFNDFEKEAEKLVPAFYVLNRNKKYTGTICVNYSDKTEEFMLDNGRLVNEKVIELKNDYDVKKYNLKNVDDVKKIDLLYRTTINDKLKRLSLIAGFGLIFLLFICIISNIISKKIKASLEYKNKIEEENKAKMLQSQKDSEELLKLKNEYESMVLASNKKIYPIINLIYNNIGKNSVVNSLSINKNSFSIELITANSLEILSNFEADKNIRYISINRTASEQNKEIVSFTGEINNEFKEPSEGLNTREKIVFYTELLKDKERETVFSEYAKEIRKLLKKSSCNEEYMQVKNINGLIELECSLRGTGSSILKLIKSIDDYPSTIEVKSLRLRNNLSSGLCNANIIFDTFIDYKQLSENDFYASGIIEKAPDEIGVIFKSTVPQTQAVRKYAPVKNVPKQNVKTEGVKKNYEKLNYLGNGADARFSKIIFLKNPSTGVIYKVPVVSSAINGDYALENGSGFHVYIGSVEYEVKR